LEHLPLGPQNDSMLYPEMPLAGPIRKKFQVKPAPKAASDSITPLLKNV